MANPLNMMGMGMGMQPFPSDLQTLGPSHQVMRSMPGTHTSVASKGRKGVHHVMQSQNAAGASPLGVDYSNQYYEKYVYGM